MDFKEWTLSGDDADRRIDRILRRLMPEKSAANIFAAMRKGLVRVNGKKAEPSYRTKEGDVLKCAAFLLKEKSADEFFSESNSKPGNGRIYSTGAIRLNEIFRNEHLLFVNKRAGDDVQSKEFLAAAKSASAEKNAIAFTPAPLHRLDRWTSGLLALSQSLQGAKWFSEKIANHSIKKFYYGIVLGRLGSLNRAEEWSDSLKNGDTNKVKTAMTSALPQKYGKTEDGIDVTLVRFQIHTGLKHQIRLQSAARGHPLLYDGAYGGETRAGQRPDSGRHFFLHAFRLVFPENPLGLPDSIEATLPEDFERICAICF